MQVQQIIDNGLLVDPQDFYYAAMVFQHGDTLSDIQQANNLAQQSMSMGYEPAKWLYAASYDRCLVFQDLPQKYGTQYRYDQNGKQIYLPIDPDTTDAERLALNVPIRNK